jgi:hypothetical protein
MIVRVVRSGLAKESIDRRSLDVGSAADSLRRVLWRRAPWRYAATGRPHQVACLVRRLYPAGSEGCANRMRPLSPFGQTKRLVVVQEIPRLRKLHPPEAGMGELAQVRTHEAGRLPSC